MAVSEIRLRTANGYGSTNTVIRRFTNVDVNAGADLTLTQSATLGDSITINTAGAYVVAISDNFNAANTAGGVSLNTTEPTVGITSLTNTIEAIIMEIDRGSTSSFISSAICFDFDVNDVIRAHSTGVAANATAFCRLTVIGPLDAAAGGGGWTTVSKTAAYTAANDEEVLADTATTGAFTVTLPASPSIGDRVRVIDSEENWGTANLTIGRNGDTIAGVASDLVLSTDEANREFVSDGAGNWNVLKLSDETGTTFGITFNSQSGANYTLVLTDQENKVIDMTSGLANDVLIPTNASVAFPIGTSIGIMSSGAGSTSVTGDTGVTVNGTSAGSETISGQYKTFWLVKVAADTWYLVGAIL